MRPEIESIVNEGYILDTRTALTKAWNRFKQGAFLFLGMALVFFILNFIFASLPIIGKLNGIFSSLLFSGYYVYCIQKDKDQENTANFFQGFRYALPLIGVEFMTMLLVLPIILLSISKLIPMELVWQLLEGSSSIQEIINPENTVIKQETGFGLLLLIASMLLVAYILLSFMFAPLLVIDRNYGIIEAIESSRKVVNKQVLSFFLFFILLGMIMISLSVLSFGIAVLFFYPFLFLLKYEFYLQIFNQEED